MNYNLSKIRIKCAEIVGWKKVPLPKVQNWGEDAGPDKQWWYEHQLPRFTESADAALELVAWMSKPENGGWDTQCSQWSRGKEWRVTFAKGEGKTYIGSIGTADTFQLALCLAFLRANGIDLETL